MESSLVIMSQKMQHYQDVWRRCMTIGGESPNLTQSEFFKTYIPTDEIDFTPIFEKFNLGELFTSPKVVTKMMGNFNCNNVFRQTNLDKQIPDILVFNDLNYMVFQPLGEPGRDVNYFKIGHFMVVNYNPDNMFTINEMIPKSTEEVDDLQSRSSTLTKAYNCLFLNKTVKECGHLVLDKATELGLPETTTIQNFLSYQIVNMPESVRSGRPGYKLMVDGNDICLTESEINKEIDNVFNVESKNVKTSQYIQGPDNCSQLASHIHGFLSLSNESQFSKDFDKTYINVDDIISYNTMERSMEPEPEPDDFSLTRQRSVRVPDTSLGRTFSSVV